MLVSTSISALIYFLPTSDPNQSEAIDRTIQVISGTIFFLGLWLLLFKKLVLTPWFTLDFSRPKPAVSLGFKGMRFVVRAEPTENYLCVGQVFIYASFLTRLTAKLLLCGIFYDLLNQQLTTREIVFAVTIFFLVLYGLERKLYDRLAWDPEKIKQRLSQPESAADPTPEV